MRKRSRDIDDPDLGWVENWKTCNSKIPRAVVTSEDIYDRRACHIRFIAIARPGARKKLLKTDQRAAQHHQ